jgi:hypothetical protein
MAKRFALAFAAVGYLVAVWYYFAAFAPVTWDPGRELLGYECVTCVNISGFRSSRLWSALMFIGPANALVYGGAGYLLAVAIRKLNRN